MAVPFVSRADLGDYLGQDLSASDKALICIDVACDVCRTFSEQTFNQVDNEEIVLDGTGTDALLLPQLPVIDVTDVTEGDTALVVDDDYKLNGGGTLLRIPTLDENGNFYSVVWTKGRQNIVITYSHGYAADDLPRDVRGVALAYAARLFQQAAGGAVTEESLGEYSVRYSVANLSGAATDLTATEQMILRRHRRW